MKKIILSIILFLPIILLSGCGTTNKINSTKDIILSTSTNSTLSSSHVIEIKNFTFSPKVLNVKIGEEVTWINNDKSPHQIKSDLFTSDIIGSGQSYSFTFNEAGNFDYICSIHPNMSGKITVYENN